MARKSKDAHLEILDEEDEIDELPSGEALGAFFDLLGDLPPVSLGRNDLYSLQLNLRILTASALHQNFSLRSRLAYRQWSLVPGKKF